MAEWWLENGEPPALILRLRCALALNSTQVGASTHPNAERRETAVPCRSRTHLVHMLFRAWILCRKSVSGVILDISLHFCDNEEGLLVGTESWFSEDLHFSWDYFVVLCEVLCLCLFQATIAGLADGLEIVLSVSNKESPYC